MEIEDVKKQILTNKDRIRNLEEDINIALIDEEDDIKQTMRRRLLQMKHPRSENALVSIKNQLTFLISIKKLKQDWSKLKGVAVESEREKGIHNLELFREWALEDRSIMTTQETTDAELEIARSRDHLKILMYQKQLAERRTTVDYGFRNKVREAERVLTKGGKYTDEKKQEVRRIIEELNTILGGLGISEEERMEIVNAMALPKGHWFQCPQGHVYAIGDCGGATSTGRCPECRAEIGGMNYQLRPGNIHTGVMDDSTDPAWSNAANMAEGFNAQFFD